MKQVPTSFVHFLICAMICALSITLGTVQAQAQSLSTVLRASSTLPTSANTAGHVTIIILDMSGSMSTNDQSGVRCSATNAYIDLSRAGDFVGVIGLDNTEATNINTQGFRQVKWVIEPREMNTLPNRLALRKAVADNSSSCRPDGFTPTYDALAQALTLLNNATNANGKHYSGSVILLTDGLPCGDNSCSDVQPQVNAIEKDLVPQYHQHNWNIDSIALGTDADFSFLKNISNATGGIFYTDVQNGTASPLNIMPYFINIFKTRIGRTPGPQIPSIDLGANGGTKSSDFTVGDFVDFLDIIAVKDTPTTSITLNDPSGHEVTAYTPGVFISQDPHYKIYSINGPQSGDWVLTAAGSGNFLMNGLITSFFNVSILSPNASHPVWPLGQNLTIQAQVFHQSTLISGTSYIVLAQIIKDGFTLQSKKMSDSASPGTFQAIVLVPENSTPGSYTISVSVEQVTNASIAEADQSIRFELFPRPSLYTQSGQLTNGVVDSTATRWDIGLQTVYGQSVGAIQWLSQLPLSDLPARTEVYVPGAIQLQGQLYDLQHVTINAVATFAGSKTPIPVDVINDGSGHFHLLFQTPLDGTYTITFNTSGTFANSYGDSWTTTSTSRVTIVGATPGSEVKAWVITFGYLVLLVFLILLIPFFLRNKPFGECLCIEDGREVRHIFRKARRNPLSILLWRNIVKSKQVGMPRGLQFRFMKPVIQVRLKGSGKQNWLRGDGNALSERFEPVPELRYDPDRQSIKGDEPRSYQILAEQGSRTDDFSYSDSFPNDGRGRSESRRKKKKSEGGSYNDYSI